MADAFTTAEQHNQRVSSLPLSIEVNLPKIPLWRNVSGGGIDRRTTIGRLMVNTMQLALQEVAGHVSDEAPRDTGNLAQSWGAFPSTSTGGIEMVTTGAGGTVNLNGRVFSSLPYAIVMDQGRRAGAPISRAGIEAIGLWAERKLGLSANEARGAKWAIAQSIVKRGIKATNFVNKGWASAQPRVQALFRILSDEMARKLVKK